MVIVGANFWGRKLSKSFHYAKSQSSTSKIIVDSVPSSESESQSSNSKITVDSVKNFLVVLYQFIYPYAMYGQFSATISASLLAVGRLSDISSLFFIGLLQALSPHLFLDIYVNGVNQVFDFEIDKCFGLHLMIGSPALISYILLNFILWTGYSVNDIPDIEGDKQHGIDSFSMRLGQKKVFWICVFLFELAFGIVFLAGATSSSPLWIKILTTKYVDETNPASTRSFYQLNWKLLMGAYFLLPLTR
ncbi:hypothetical protein VNO80_14693 [Phaseolus coccineus]|uniref:Uncharacterized protein n=1 Tax=Phaseolus coccineus TaxID=3886 RepID=A0AAN9MJ70_PHACN